MDPNSEIATAGGGESHREKMIDTEEFGAFEGLVLGKKAGNPKREQVKEIQERKRTTTIAGPSKPNCPHQKFIKKIIGSSWEVKNSTNEGGQRGGPSPSKRGVVF